MIPVYTPIFVRSAKNLQPVGWEFQGIITTKEYRERTSTNDAETSCLPVLPVKIEGQAGENQNDSHAGFPGAIDGGRNN